MTKERGTKSWAGKNNKKLRAVVPLKLQQSMVPPSELKLLGKPPLVRGEKASDYFRLRLVLAGDLKPQTFVQWIMVDDITRLTWIEARLRRAEAGLFEPLPSGRSFMPDFMILDRGGKTPPQQEVQWWSGDPSKPPLPVSEKPEYRSGELPTLAELGTRLRQDIDVIERCNKLSMELARRRDSLLRDFSRQQAVQKKKFNDPEVLDLESTEINDD